MTPERKVKNAVTNILKKNGSYYFYPVTGGYGSSGVPDIVGCYKGYFFAIECKAGDGQTTALQWKNLEEIRNNGGVAIVVNEKNLPEVQEFFNNLSKKGV